MSESVGDDRLLPILGGLAALIPAIAMWGFTVDDALITIRYAHHIASGAGYRFNVHGGVTDGVTPLPFVWLLVPLAAGAQDPLVILDRAKGLGVAAWTIAAMGLGHTLGSTVKDRRQVATAILGLFVMAIAFPIGAWAASGMETGLVTALATLTTSFAVRPGRRMSRIAAILAGVSAAFRPELVVWAIFLAGGLVGAAKERAERVALASAPFVLCVAVRLVIFGRPTPLALMAKPSDFAHGLSYALAATIVILTPLLAFAPVTIARARPTNGTGASKAIAIAALAHGVVVIAVGGDWMPYARLMVPIAPSLVIVFVETTAITVERENAKWPILATARAILVTALGLALIVTGAGRGRRVHEDRRELIAKARPLLASSKVIASLDIGWTGAAAREDATIIDLAGVTDPEIAALPGGHTSKAVDLGMLLDRNVDTLLIYAHAPRWVEIRLLRSPLFTSRFEHIADVPLGRDGARYAFYRRVVRDTPKSAD